MPMMLAGMKTPVHPLGMNVAPHCGHVHTPFASLFIFVPSDGQARLDFLGIVSPPIICRGGLLTLHSCCI